MTTPKIENPKTGNLILVNGPTFKKLIDEGYLYKNKILTKKLESLKITKTSKTTKASKTVKTTTILDLPKDMLYKVMEKKSISEIFSMCNSNKHLDAFLCKNENFWRKRLKDDFGRKEEKKSIKSQYVAFYKYKNSQKEILRALGFGLKFFKLITLEGKMAIYDSVVAFFNKKYKDNYKIYIISKIGSGINKHERRDLYTMSKIRSVVSAYENFDGGFSEGFDKVNENFNESSDEVNVYYDPFTDDTTAKIFQNNFIIPLVLELLKTITTSWNVNVVNTIDRLGNPTEYEDDFVEFSVKVFEGWVKYKIHN